MPAKPPAVMDGESHPLHDALLDKLVGNWKVGGKVAGQPIRLACEAEWVLNHQFLRLHFIDQGSVEAQRGETEKRGAEYEAEVFIGYDNMSERYVTHWLDTFGGRFSESLGYGRPEGANAVKFVFEYPNGPLHNTFTWKPKEKAWSILIKQKNGNGKWATFANEVLERTSRMGN